MNTTLCVLSDQLNKADVTALLQAIRDCEVATFPDKKIRVVANVQELTTAETNAMIMSIKPPFKKYDLDIFGFRGKRR